MTDKMVDKMKALKARVKLTKDIMKAIKEGLSVDDVKKLLKVKSTQQSATWNYYPDSGTGKY